MAIKRAKNAFGYMEGDPPTPRVVNPGMLFEETDPVVQRYPNAFEDVETHVTRTREQQRQNVEAATAAPGERRTRTAPRRTTRTRKKADEETPTQEEQARQLGLVGDDSDDT